MLSKCSVARILKVPEQLFGSVFFLHLTGTWETHDAWLHSESDRIYLLIRKYKRDLKSYLTDPRRFRWPLMMSSLSSIRWLSEIIQKLYSFFTAETRMNGVSSVWGKEEHGRVLFNAQTDELEMLYCSMQSLASLILVNLHIYREACKVCTMSRVLVEAQDEVINYNHDTYSYILCICPQIMVLRSEHILVI